MLERLGVRMEKEGVFLIFFNFIATLPLTSHIIHNQNFEHKLMNSFINIGLNKILNHSYCMLTSLSTTVSTTYAKDLGLANFG